MDPEAKMYAPIAAVVTAKPPSAPPAIFPLFDLLLLELKVLVSVEGNRDEVRETGTKLMGCTDTADLAP